jgi:hypothetical protein
VKFRRVHFGSMYSKAGYTFPLFFSVSVEHHTKTSGLYLDIKGVHVWVQSLIKMFRWRKLNQCYTVRVTDTEIIINFDLSKDHAMKAYRDIVIKLHIF